MTETICLDALKEVNPREKVPLEVEVELPPNEYGAVFIRRKRWRTFGEVYQDMHTALYLRVCSQCGNEAKDGHREWEKPCKKCGGEMEALIDEYDSGPSHLREHRATTEIGKPKEVLGDIVCHCSVGANEGYRAEMGVMLRTPHQDGYRYVALYWVKSFRGMEHVHHLVERMMKATGVWPKWA